MCILSNLASITSKKAQKREERQYLPLQYCWINSWNSHTEKHISTNLHLLGSDIVSANDEALRILIEEAGQLAKVVGFPSALVLPNHLEAIKDRLRTLLKKERRS